MNYSKKAKPMKHFPKIMLIMVAILMSTQSFALKKKIKISASQSDADIYVDGQLMGTGQLDVVVLNNSCVTVNIVKTGYLVDQVTFCNKKSSPNPPKTYYVEMTRDDSFDASIQTDIANVDINLSSNKSEEETWKLISQIIMSYFDVIEVTDRETGYLRTSWVVQSFKQNTVRTRIILKAGSTDPLSYKVKLVSEASGSASTSVKSDEKFKEWDRVLRKYQSVLDELQNRL